MMLGVRGGVVWVSDPQQEERVWYTSHHRLVLHTPRVCTLEHENHLEVLLTHSVNHTLLGL